MTGKKSVQTGLADEERLRFDRFIEWYNQLREINDRRKFKFDDTEFQSFITANEVILDFKNPIPNQVIDGNKIFYDVKNSKVGSLARHIRNAYAHSRIIKKNGFLQMEDIYFDKKNKHITMKGCIAVDVMWGLLAAIQKNKCDRSKKDKNTDIPKEKYIRENT